MVALMAKSRIHSSGSLSATAPLMEKPPARWTSACTRPPVASHTEAASDVTASCDERGDIIGAREIARERRRRVATRDECVGPDASLLRLAIHEHEARTALGECQRHCFAHLTRPADAGEHHVPALELHA